MQSLYDPLAPMGKYRPLTWGLLALAVLVFQTPRFLASLPGNLNECQDFFQDWASVKYFRDGISPYTHLHQAFETYLQIPTRDKDGKEILHLHVRYNAHPPPSLFFVMPFSYLPFSYLSFSQPTIAWNLAGFVLYGLSLTYIWKTLELSFPLWGIFPLTVLTLMGGPWVSQVSLAQWNFLLLFFLVLHWRAFGLELWQR